MSQKRFPNSEDILELREKGIVSISSQVCHLVAGTSLILFLFSRNFGDRVRNLLSISSLEDSNLWPELTKTLNSFVVGLCLYIGMYLLAAFLQSRFYFRPGRFFKRSQTFFSIRRAFSFIKLAVLTRLTAITIFVILVALIWRQIFTAQIGLIQNASFPMLVDDITSLGSKLFLALVTSLIASILVILFYAKITFLFRERLLTKR